MVRSVARPRRSAREPDLPGTRHSSSRASGGSPSRGASQSRRASSRRNGCGSGRSPSSWPSWPSGSVGVGRRWRDLAAAAVVALRPVFSIPWIDSGEAPLDRLYVVESVSHSFGLLSGTCSRASASMPSSASPERRRAVRWALGAFAGTAVVLGLVWLFGRGNLPGLRRARSSAELRLARRYRPLVGLGRFGALAMIERRPCGRRWSGRVVPSGWHSGSPGRSWCSRRCSSSSTTHLCLRRPRHRSNRHQEPSPCSVPSGPRSSAWGTTKRQVLRGLWARIRSEHQHSYGVHQFAEYDPIAPLVVVHQLAASRTARPLGYRLVFYFTPGIKSATIARRYGVSYVLEPRRGGRSFRRRLRHAGRERGPLPDPRAATATLVPAVSSGGWPAIDARGTAVPRHVAEPLEGSAHDGLRPLHKSFGCGWPHCPGGTPRSTGAR